MENATIVSTSIVYEGDASLLINQNNDLTAANINRNILLNDMQSYVNCFKLKGTLLLSGFTNTHYSYRQFVVIEKD
jgi:ribosomal protein L11 methyltransferase